MKTLNNYFKKPQVEVFFCIKKAIRIQKCVRSPREIPNEKDRAVGDFV